MAVVGGDFCPKRDCEVHPRDCARECRCRPCRCLRCRETTARAGSGVPLFAMKDADAAPARLEIIERAKAPEPEPAQGALF